MNRLLVIGAILYLSAVCHSADSANSATAAFSRLQGLAGEWEGSFQWSGARGAAGKMNATYYATGNDSAMVENLTVDGKPVMTSVYHLDGADLRLTHFCAAQNQPRLKADRIDMARGVVNFSFVDITNLRAPDAGHVAALEIRFPDPNHIVLTFLFESGSQHSSERIELQRSRPLPPKPAQ